MSLASAPPSDFILPDDVAAITGPTVEPIWLNEVGGLTVRFRPGTEAEARTETGADTAGDGENGWRYLKRNPLPSSEDLALEAEKLTWLGPWHPVPAVVDCFRDGDVEYLITEAIPGDNAVSAENRNRPDRAIAAIGRGLRRLHDLPGEDCPWTWSVRERLALIDRDAESTRESLGPAPEIDRLVVCHGDPCAPNTLIGEDGAFVGHVDMQRLGLADRWADLAVVTMSFEWNYEEFDESVFWDAYGIAPDAERIAYYRALWNAE